MAVKFNHNADKAATAVVKIIADEAIHRNRFSKHSIQTTGDVYVSNKMLPSTNTAAEDWAKIASADFGNVYILDAPVNWVVCTAEANICSYVSGNM